MSLVEMRRVTFRYYRAGEPALRDVDLTVRSGELLCLVGPSGCGKTTLLKIMGGLLAPESGDVVFDGQKITHVPPERRRAALVFQNHMLFPFMSAGDNVGFGLRMQGVDRRTRDARSLAMLERVHLAGFADRRPGSLSAGQQQRVALARALVTEPRVLLLDEPLSNLDRHLREEMRQAIIELQRETRVTTICVTHDQEEAVLLGDRIAMLRDGEVAQVGTAEEFYERPASVAVARFFGNHNHIEGVLSGITLDSAAGQFRVDRAGTGTMADGPVCLHIRPEAIRLVDPGDPPAHGKRNCLRGVVAHRVFVGTHVRYTVTVEGHPWQVVSSPALTRHEEGEAVGLYLPPDRIWLTRE